MSAIKALAPVFVASFPERLEAGKLYVSMEFASVAHLCACGCGAEVVTPLSPTDWRLSFDGAGVTLEPSIGSWRLPCRSHYLIRRNRVVWAGDMSDDHIEFGRQRDRLAKQRYHHRSNVPQEPGAEREAGSASKPRLASASTDMKPIQPPDSVLAHLRRWLRRSS
jgi:Family of unknown function (DUF6527)